jgi:hypothetical protein
MLCHLLLHQIVQAPHAIVDTLRQGGSRGALQSLGQVGVFAELPSRELFELICVDKVTVLYHHRARHHTCREQVRPD